MLGLTVADRRVDAADIVECINIVSDRRVGLSKRLLALARMSTKTGEAHARGAPTVPTESS